MPHGDATYESMPAWWQLTFGVLSFLVVLYCVKIDDKANEELQRRTQEQEHDQQHGHRRSKQKAH